LSARKCQQNGIDTCDTRQNARRLGITAVGKCISNQACDRGDARSTAAGVPEPTKVVPYIVRVLQDEAFHLRIAAYDVSTRQAALAKALAATELSPGGEGEEASACSQRRCGWCGKQMVRQSDRARGLLADCPLLDDLMRDLPLSVLFLLLILRRARRFTPRRRDNVQMQGELAVLRCLVCYNHVAVE
jgi:hypothetical protein